MYGKVEKQTKSPLCVHILAPLMTALSGWNKTAAVTWCSGRVTTFTDVISITMLANALLESSNLSSAMRNAWAAASAAEETFCCASF